MKRYISIFMFLLAASFCMAQANARLTDRLDSLIDKADKIYAEKEANIALCKKMISRDRKPESLFSAYENLYNEYFVYQFDSAMVYTDKAVALAENIGDRYEHDKWLIKKASLLAVGGLYGEAIASLSSIDTLSLDNDLRFQYAITSYNIYTYWADYCHDQVYSPHYRQIAANYLRQAVGMLKKDTPCYDFFLGEYYIYVERNDKLALNHYFKTLKSVSIDSRWYAMASFAIANNYSANGNDTKYEEYMLRACISDILSCTRENLALQDFAMYLYKKGDCNILRAERYINFAMDDAKNYNNRLRIIEISQKLPVIVSTYREKLSQQNRSMRIALWGVSILFVFVIVLLYFYMRQNRQLGRHRHELSENNTILSEMNNTLNSLNIRLVDTNRRRERLAKLYIDLCADYIGKLSKFEVLVKRKVKVGQVSDLLNIASSSRLSEEDAATFMNQFDVAFLDLYPSFVSEFNELLKDGEHIVPPHRGRLTTELRIFALIRLGVKDSSEIAALLFYTPRTIYNYRSSVKNRARNRDTFEEDVLQLCSVIHNDEH